MPADKPKKQRKDADPSRRTCTGRPKLPVVDTRLVPAEQRTCPTCKVEAAHVTFERGAEKRELVPARFVVKQVQNDVVACQCCHEYIVRASRADEIVDRGIIGDELAVQATVEPYQNAVPWGAWSAKHARKE